MRWVECVFSVGTSGGKVSRYFKAEGCPEPLDPAYLRVLKLAFFRAPSHSAFLRKQTRRTEGKGARIHRSRPLTVTVI